MNRVRTIISLTSILAIMLLTISGCSSRTPQSDTIVESDHYEKTRNPLGFFQIIEVEPEEKVSYTAISPTTIFRKDGITITATETIDDSPYGPGVKFLVENDTNYNIFFTCDDFIVNGICLYGDISINVAAGKKANGSLYFMNDLPTRNITDFATIIGVNAQILDSDTYDTLHYVPLEIVTTAADNYVQDLNIGDYEVFDQDGIVATAKVVHRDDYGSTPYILIANNNDYDICVSAKNVSINGYTIDTFMNDTVFSNTMRLSAIEWYSSDLEENDITTLHEITFTLEFYSAETYATIGETEEILLTFD